LIAAAAALLALALALALTHGELPCGPRARDDDVVVVVDRTRADLRS
jgi:hypothetical protein